LPVALPWRWLRPSILPPFSTSIASYVVTPNARHAERVSRDGAELARSLGLDAEPLAVPDAGDVAGTILNAAAEHKAVAIIVGSRGLSGLRARLEGSTSAAVIKRASCPVIVVHEPANDD
jgi:nucleotide-binding universal stress UspA family protein